MADDESLSALGDAQFVSLTTFRRSGEPVPTTVWIARDGAALVVTTPDGSGKVKRLRRDPRVELRPSSRGGAVDEAVAPRAGVAEIITDPTGLARGAARLRDKYGLQYRLITLVERLVDRRGRRRVILRITPGSG
ncbi:MAG TPA: PPOX class F420-dependent oxidoreductase [Nocardioidaceae bacterium]|nr:PPOX class F420-dependent oxidoreductase [Nocardioidaceae bacterium]